MFNQFCYLLLFGSLLLFILFLIGAAMNRVPDKLFLCPSDQEIMSALTWDLEVAQKNFDEAVTQGQVEAATYEYTLAQKRLDEFRKEVGME